MALTKPRLPFDIADQSFLSDGVVYDFVVDGGVVGNIPIASIPDNSTIVKAFYEIITPFTSGGLATELTITRNAQETLCRTLERTV